MNRFICYFFLLVSAALVNGEDFADTFASSQGDGNTGTTASTQDYTTSSQVTGTEACVDATVADVVFLVDSSGSIGSANFQEVREFLQNLVSGLEIGPDNVRVGLAQYNQDPVPEFSLLEHTDKNSLLVKLGSLQYLGGGTQTGEAIDFIRTQLFTESAGSRASQGVPQIAVVITDGVSGDDVVQPAMRLREHGVTVFAIGVGGANVNELEAIASQPSDHFRFLIDNFQSLQSVSEVVLENICESITNQTQIIDPSVCVNATVADVVFLVDSSGSIGNANFQEVREFLQNLVSGLDIGPDNVRVGLAQYNQDPVLEFSLLEHMDKNSLLAELGSLPYLGGGTQTGEALDFIRTQLFTQSAGSRASQGVPQIAVVITDGVSGDDVVQPAMRLREHGVTVFAIGVGGGANLAELEAIANQPSEDFRFLIDNFQSLQSASEVVLENICDAIYDQLHVQGPSACVDAKVADVVFLVDSSGSIGNANFQEVREFLQNVVSGLDIGPNNVRVGLAQYNQNPVLEFSLLEHMDKSSLLAELGSLPYLGGGTQTGKAIDFIRTQLFTESAGSRASQGVPQIAVVITDGVSGDDVVQPAMRLREHGVTVFAIGVGGGANLAELEAIASQPSDHFRFLIDNFQSLQSASEVVLENICDAITSHVQGPSACVDAKVADVVFLVDSSGSIGNANFQEVREFLQNLVSGLDIGPNNVRVGLAQYNQNPVLEFSLLEHMDKDSLLAELGSLPYLGGGTQTGRAIDFIRTQLFTESAGSRASQGVPQIAVVITDGVSGDDVVQPAMRLREHGVTVFAIGVGGGANVAELEAIANQPSEDFRFLIDNFQSLQNVSEVVLENICDAITSHDDVFEGTACLEVKAQGNFTLASIMPEILRQIFINATREFCDDCQFEFALTLEEAD